MAFRLAPLVLRVAAGSILIGFGQSKFTHHEREANAFDRYGLPDPSVFAYAIGAVELGCGVLLVLGLAARPAAAVLAGDMIGALATGARVDGGFANLVLAPALLVVMLVIARLGAGSLSLDGVLLRRRL